MDVDQVSADAGAALSRPARVLVAAVAVAVGLGVAIHLGIVFFHLAPTNVVSKTYRSEITAYISPEFEQGWQLFAPDPLHVSVAIEARARVRAPDGRVQTTPWLDASAPAIENTRGSLVPSHTRNELRKGWRRYDRTHDDDHVATSTRGLLIEKYLKRLVLMHLRDQLPDGTVDEVQLRARKVSVAEPVWSDRRADTRPRYVELPWWPVHDDDQPARITR